VKQEPQRRQLQLFTMKLKKLKQQSLRFLGQYVLSNLVTALCKSLSITVENAEAVKELQKQNQNFVLAFWHGTMLLPWYLHRNQNFTGLTSKSKDGDLLAKLLRNWKYNVVRGSSSTGGDVALGIMIDYAKNKSSVAVTPDGPKGPPRKMKAGAVVAAKKSNVPLVLLGVGFSKKRNLKSWDRFEIPGFFSKVKVIYSDPVYISNELNYEKTSEMINKCEQTLNELQKRAESF
jgi:lysophospholipid acyltransferase (LPLAT)-like uncharacterized protein